MRAKDRKVSWFENLSTDEAKACERLLRMLAEKAAETSDEQCILQNLTPEQLGNLPEKKRSELIEDPEWQLRLLSSCSVIESEALLGSRGASALKFAPIVWASVAGSVQDLKIFDRRIVGFKPEQVSEALLQRDHEANLPLHVCSDVVLACRLAAQLPKACSMPNSRDELPVNSFMKRNPVSREALLALAPGVWEMFRPDEAGISAAMRARGTCRAIVFANASTWEDFARALEAPIGDVHALLVGLRPAGKWQEVLAFHLFHESEVWQQGEHTELTRRRLQVVWTCLEAAFEASVRLCQEATSDERPPHLTLGALAGLARELLQATKGPWRPGFDARQPYRAQLDEQVARTVAAVRECYAVETRKLGAYLPASSKWKAQSKEFSQEDKSLGLWFQSEKVEDIGADKMVQTSALEILRELPTYVNGIPRTMPAEALPPWVTAEVPDWAEVAGYLHALGCLGSDDSCEVYRMLRLAGAGSEAADGSLAWYVGRWHMAWLEGVCQKQRICVLSFLKKSLGGRHIEALKALSHEEYCAKMDRLCDQAEALLGQKQQAQRRREQTEQQRRRQLQEGVPQGDLSDGQVDMDATETEAADERPQLEGHFRQTLEELRRHAAAYAFFPLQVTCTLDSPAELYDAQQTLLKSPDLKVMLAERRGFKGFAAEGPETNPEIVFWIRCDLGEDSGLNYTIAHVELHLELASFSHAKDTLALAADVAAMAYDWSPVRSQRGRANTGSGGQPMLKFSTERCKAADGAANFSSLKHVHLLKAKGPDAEAYPKWFVHDLVDAMRKKRGSVLRSFRLDLDIKRRGSLRRLEFQAAAKILGGVLVEPHDLWVELRGKWSSALVELIDLCPEEGELVECFMDALWVSVGTDPVKVWRSMDALKAGCILAPALGTALASLGVRGNVDSLVNGFTGEVNRRVTCHDVEHVMRVATDDGTKLLKTRPMKTFAEWVQNRPGGLGELAWELGMMKGGILADRLAEQLTGLNFPGEAGRVAIRIARYLCRLTITQDDLRIVLRIATSGPDRPPWLTSAESLAESPRAAEADPPRDPILKATWVNEDVWRTPLDGVKQNLSKPRTLRRFFGTEPRRTISGSNSRWGKFTRAPSSVKPPTRVPEMKL